MRRFLPGTAVSAMVLSLLAAAPQAVQAQGYFIPNQAQPQRPAAPAAPPAGRPTPRPSPRLAPPPQADQRQGGAGDPQGAGDQAAQQLPQLPPPDLPPLPKGSTPPAAVIGAIGVPDVMAGSTAAQQVNKTIGERREKLNEDAQKEQGAWRDMQQALASDRAKLSPEQIRSREKELQERITNAQRQFRERNQTIQQAAQFGLAQIERMLVAVIRQVAESRGMNLVLHRSQIALNVNEFDITDQVADQLNKTLPSVVIPADGVVPTAQMLQQVAASTTPTPPVTTVTTAPGAPAPAATPTAAPTPAPAPPAPSNTKAPPAAQKK